MADAPIARLRRVAAVLRANADPDAAWLVAGIDRYQDEAGAGVTLDGMLGLSRRGGAGPWWIAEARERRDQAVREMRVIAFGEMEPPQAAVAIRAAVRRRRQGAAAATAAEVLADRVLRTGVALPTSRKQMMAILQRGQTAN